MPLQFNIPKVMNQIKNFLSTETMVDVTLVCDGQSLKAHKIVLSAYSSFFRSLFLENPCKHPIVMLKDVKYTELQLLIDFMYCGEVNIAEDQLSAVIKTAQTLRVKGLGEVEFENSQSNRKTKKASGYGSDNLTGKVTKNQSSNTFCFKWNNHAYVMNEFKTFLASQTMVDVTLGCDGHSLKAHKLVLSACSPFFRSLFLENPCKHPIVILKDLKYSVLKSVIDFMYCGELNLGKDPLSAVIKAAQALKVKGLIELESQSSQHSDQSGNRICDESKNQSAKEMAHEPICMIDVSNWTLTEKESLSDPTIDGGFITEIKQEHVFDDIDVDISQTSTVSLESHESNPFLISEQNQPVEQSFEVSASNNVHQQTLTANNTNLSSQTLQLSVQSNTELHEGNSSNSVSIIPIAVDNQESSTSSASPCESVRSRNLENIPVKPVQQLCNSQKPEVNSEKSLIVDFVLTSLRDRTFQNNLTWDVKERGVFLLKWSHKRTSTWTVKDAALFLAWDRIKGRPEAKTSAEFVQAKDRFRADLKEEKTIQKLRYSKAYERYKIRGSPKQLLEKQEFKKIEKRPHEKWKEFLGNTDNNTDDYRPESSLSGRKNLECKKCSYKTRYTTNFIKHILLKHEKQLKCAHCTYKTSLKENLVEHVNKVHKSTRFQCTFCPYNSAQEAQLKMHMSCIHEQKNSSESENYDFHSSQKESEGNDVIVVPDHVCPCCTYRSDDAQSLIRHMRLMHKKEEPTLNGIKYNM